MKKLLPLGTLLMTVLAIVILSFFRTYSMTSVANAATSDKCGTSTALAFRTPPSGVSIAPGLSKGLGKVDVSCFDHIRVVAVERPNSITNIRLHLIITQGDELVAHLDTPILTPHSEVSKIYMAPGMRLTISAEALPTKSAGTNIVEVLVYGR